MARADAEAVLAHRTRLVYWAWLAALAAFACRLYFLQVVSAEKYKGTALANSVKERPLEAPRGLILDRKGRVLVGNRGAYDLVIDREHVKDWDAVARFVSGVTGQPPDDLLAAWRRHADEANWRPLVAVHGLGIGQVAHVEARREEAPQVSIETETVRSYPALLAPHVLGYVAEVDPQELKKPEIAEYHDRGDLIGKAGIERRYDKLLSGRRGKRQVVVNNVGREIRSTITEPPVRGDDLRLTLDADVQAAAERALSGWKGAIVALDPRDGGVLAIASSPAFESDAFVGGISSVRWKQYQDDPADPLQFRAVAGAYPPGSVFKVVVTAATLESRTHDPSFSVVCRGVADFYGTPRHCWKEGGHGLVDMRLAIENSCNIFYYTVARDTGLEPIERLGRLFGFGEATGIDLPGERAGTMPGDAWKRKNVGEQWYPGDTINLGIGQGFLAVTPLQVATFGMAIANGGRMYRPHLLASATEASTGKVVETAHPEVIRDVPLAPSTVAFLHSSMEDVVRGGTGTKAQVPGIRVAGKTGTAQPATGEAPEGVPKAERDERYQEHAWFMGFAPVEAPEIVVAAVFEHAGMHGGEIAAPAAREVMEAYFGDRVQATGQ